jgi:hypothetical protein
VRRPGSAAARTLASDFLPAPGLDKLRQVTNVLGHDDSTDLEGLRGENRVAVQFLRVRGRPTTSPRLGHNVAARSSVTVVKGKYVSDSFRRSRRCTEATSDSSKKLRRNS